MTCPNFSQMPLPQRMTGQPEEPSTLLLRSQQVWSKSGSARPCSSPGGSPPTGSTIDRLFRRYCALGIHPNRLSGQSTSPICVCGVSLQKTWPKRASSLSLTSIRLPTSEHSHQPSPNQMVFQMQCHSMWPCSNPTRDKFIDAMARELGQHTELKHWKIIHKTQVPKNAKPIPMVWTLSCKRDPAAQTLKWKARLCAGGHRQVFGDTYWTTFAPVVSWTLVWCVFIVALLLGWHMRSLDFMMAYTKLT